MGKKGVNSPHVKKPGVGTGNGGGDTAPKRTKDQIILDRIEMVQLLRRGWSKKMVAEKFKLHHTMISYDWKIVLAELRDSSDSALEEMVEAAVEQYRETAREAWAAWERSKEDARRKSVEEDNADRTCTVCEGSGKVVGGGSGVGKAGKNGAGSVPNGGKGGKGGGKEMECFYCKGKGVREPRTRTITTTEAQCGDARYLTVVMNATNRICELKSLYPSKKVDVSANVVDWSALAGEIPLDGPVPDRIEQEIQKAMLGGSNEQDS